ncbi:MAG: c-type cytochrome, partial [Planctomycetaceae bacterium]|nr:c-type cytochrome [Planctomycetaceae bacterium]
APVLDDVGSRVRLDWLRKFLAEPHATKPGTSMPDLLGHVAPDQRRAHVESLLHYLATTGSVADTHADQTAAKRGRAMFERIGCTACHDSQKAAAKPLATSVLLPDLAAKYTSASLAAFLKDPLKSRPSGRMPAFGLKDEEYRDLAMHFLDDIQLPPNVRYAVYHGSWEKLPKFDELKPAAKGECAGFDLSVADRQNNFAIRFETNMYLAASEQQMFYLGSDDGSRLTVGGNVVCDNDGVHAHQEVTGRHSFEAGWQPVVVEYLQGGGEWTLEVETKGRGVKRQPLSTLASLTTDKPLATEVAATGFEVNADLAAKGRDLFGSLGCASCHQLKGYGPPVMSEIQAKALTDLKGEGGCLAETALRGLPAYHFTPRQRTVLTTAIQSLKTPREPSTVETIHDTFVAFNCYACHKRGELGGVEADRDAFFTTKQPEMGDEGRLPPALTGVGDKLQDAWLKQIIEQGASDRQQYLHSKMPRFHNRNVGHLPAALIAVDRQPDTAPNPAFAEPDYRIKAAGRHLTGGKALSCIKCHDFAQHPSQGVRAISLTTMTKRLRPDWFHRYLLDPQAYRPGTRMPAPWPFGQTTVRDVLSANVDQQIRAVWLYLADGDKAPVPVGLVREPIELVPDGAPVIYRNFIEGAGTRAIGVGYPEKVNVAWDANDMQLALIWHGAFIDASKHWNGRGQGFEHPLGDDVLQLPKSRPLAQLASVNEAWPDGVARESGFKFRGYELDVDQRPTFRYEVNGLSVTEKLSPKTVPEVKYPHLSRELSLTGPMSESPWYFRAAVADKLESTAAGTYVVDGVWMLRISGGETPVVRDADGQRELLVPIKLSGQPLGVRLDYAW